MKTYKITYNKKYSKRGSGHKASQVAHAIAGLCSSYVECLYEEDDKVIIVEANPGKFMSTYEECESAKFMQCDYAEEHGVGEGEYTAWAMIV